MYFIYKLITDNYHSFAPQVSLDSTLTYISLLCTLSLFSGMLKRAHRHFPGVRVVCFRKSQNDACKVIYVLLKMGLNKAYSRILTVTNVTCPSGFL